MRKLTALLVVSFLFTVQPDIHAAKSIFKKKTPPKEVVAEKKDTAAVKKPEKPATPPKGPKTFDQLITKKAVSTKGFINVHKDDNKYYLEIYLIKHS